GCLVLTAAMHPVRPPYTLAELKRRSKKSNSYVLELDRYELHVALATLLRTTRAILLVMIVCCLVGALGWLGGVISIILAVIYPSAARIGGVKRDAQGIYKKIEPKLLDFTDRFQPVLHAFREPSTNLREAPRKLDSR